MTALVRLRANRHCEEPTGDEAIQRLNAQFSGLLRLARNDEKQKTRRAASFSSGLVLQISTLRVIAGAIRDDK
jgi:hypothetical protein